MKELITTGDVMRTLGGTRAVAELTGRKYTAAAHWFNFKKFPADTVWVMRAALEESGYTAPFSLWGIPLPEKTVVHIGGSDAA